MRPILAMHPQQFFDDGLDNVLILDRIL